MVAGYHLGIASAFIPYLLYPHRILAYTSFEKFESWRFQLTKRAIFVRFWVLSCTKEMKYGGEPLLSLDLPSHEIAWDTLSHPRYQSWNFGSLTKSGPIVIPLSGRGHLETVIPYESNSRALLSVQPFVSITLS